MTKRMCAGKHLTPCLINPFLCLVGLPDFLHPVSLITSSFSDCKDKNVGFFQFILYIYNLAEVLVLVNFYAPVLATT